MAAYSGVFSKIAATVQQQIGLIVTDDSFQINPKETTEDMVMRIENHAILAVAEDLKIGADIVLACYQDSKMKNF